MRTKTLRRGQPLTSLVIWTMVTFPATIAETRSSSPDYESMTYVDLLMEMKKAVPESELRSGNVLDHPREFSCRDTCGKMTKGFCSCRPSCLPAGNCCVDFRSECPLQYERLQTDLWWLRHVQTTCSDKGIQVVTSCPSPDSPLHADHFTQTTFTSTPKVTHISAIFLARLRREIDNTDVPVDPKSSFKHNLRSEDTSQANVSEAMDNLTPPSADGVVNLRETDASMATDPEISESRTEVLLKRERTTHGKRAKLDLSSVTSNPKSNSPSHATLMMSNVPKALADQPMMNRNHQKRDTTKLLDLKAKEKPDIETEALNSNVEPPAVDRLENLNSQVLTASDLFNKDSTVLDRDTTRSFLSTENQDQILINGENLQGSMKTFQSTTLETDTNFERKSTSTIDPLDDWKDLYPQPSEIMDKFNREIESLFITDLHTGLVFASSSVMACYSHLVKQPVYWTLGSRTELDSRLGSNSGTLASLAGTMMQAYVVSIPPENTAEDLEFCEKEVISSCPADYQNEIVSRRCRESIAYLQVDYEVYNNPFCVFCHIKSSQYPLIFSANNIGGGMYRFHETFSVTMDISVEYKTLRFVSSIDETQVLSKGMLFTNWKEFVCSLEADDVEKLIKNSGSSKVTSDEDVISKTPTISGPLVTDKSTNGLSVGAKTGNAIHVPLLEGQVQTVSFTKGCELQACRIGRLVQGQGCLARVYYIIRLPPTPGDVCRGMLKTIVSRIYTEINSQEKMMYPVSESIDLIGSLDGHNIYQLVVVADSPFDLTKAKPMLDKILYVLSSYMVSTGVKKNEYFCIFLGDYIQGRLPNHVAHHCPIGNEEAINILPVGQGRPLSDLADLANVCSGQASNRLRQVNVLTSLSMSLLCISVAILAAPHI